MKFLRQYFNALKEYTAKLLSQSPQIISLSDTVHQREQLTRFLKTKRQIKRSTNKPAKEALIPRKGETELSVFRTDELTLDEIWSIGDSIIQGTEHRIHGGANLIAEQVLELGLGLRADNEPPRHANITGFPMEKFERQDIANELAEVATLVLKP